MSHACLQIATYESRPRNADGCNGGASRRGFSLVELMVVISIMALLVGLLGAALAGARNGSKKQATQLLISKLDAIIQQQFATYASQTAKLPPDTNNDGRPDLPSGMTAAAYRSWYIRRNLISGDLPDRWTDVAALAAGNIAVDAGTSFPVTAAQRAYASLWRGMPSATQAAVGQTYAGAECLFMIVMQGGVANCLDCGELKTADRGDKDRDGAYEFWDAWGNPIGFILWPAAVQLPPSSGLSFFSGSRALENPFPAPGIYPSPSLGMRPLIYSAGPNGEYGFDRAEEASSILAGMNCGNWSTAPTQNSAGKVDGIDYRADNITNLDGEVAK